MNKMLKLDIIKECSKKYFKLTGESPDFSFWTFLDVCEIEPNEKSLTKFYYEMEDYIAKP